jgi:stringent starvation protein B
VYNLISNNCQTYALQLLDAIKAGGDIEFGTTLAIYDRLTGKGKVADLYAGSDEPETEPEPEPQPKPSRTDTVTFAQQVMNDNTNQLDTQEEMKKQNKKKGNVFTRFLKS